MEIKLWPLKKIEIIYFSKFCNSLCQGELSFLGAMILCLLVKVAMGS